jgi:hypothetical protein
MTFMPVTPSVGKEKRILGGRQKVNSQCVDGRVLMRIQAVDLQKVPDDKLDRRKRPTV